MSRTSAPRRSTSLLAAGLATVAVAGGLPGLLGTASAATGTAVQLQAPAAITYTQAAPLAGRLVKAGTTTGLGGRQVVLQKRPRGATAWSTLTSVTTAADGRFRAAPKPAGGTEYRAVFAGNASTARSMSAARLVGVRALVRATLDRTTVAQGETFTLKVTVAPAAPGKRVTWQHLAGGTWTTGGGAVLDGASTALIRLSNDTVGVTRLRAVRAAEGSLLAGTSGTLVSTVTQAETPEEPPMPPGLPPSGGELPPPPGTGGGDLGDPPPLPPGLPTGEPGSVLPPGQPGSP